MINVKNEQQLLKVLKKISKTSLLEAKRSVFEYSDPYRDQYVSQFESDEDRYGSLTEQEEAEWRRERERQAASRSRRRGGKSRKKKRKTKRKKRKTKKRRRKRKRKTKKRR